MELKLRFSSIFGVLKFGVSGLLMQIGHQARGGGGRAEGGSLIYICAVMKWGGTLSDDTKNSCVADYYEGCGFQTVYYGIGYINLDV